MNWLPKSNKGYFADWRHWQSDRFGMAYSSSGQSLLPVSEQGCSRRTPLLRDQPIADTRFGAEMSGPGGIGLQFTPQLRHIHAQAGTALVHCVLGLDGRI